jgi:hypothetical protein
MGFGEPIQPRTDLSREQAQTMLADNVERSLIALKDELIEHFRLRPDDLPQTPQYRKRETVIPKNRNRGSTGFDD